jgi:methylated-DNA-[protein]-cysteine S-methyltransferase
MIKNSKFFMKGTKFQRKVWNYLKSIERGKIKTYKQVAIGIKSPRAARAVANACARNPYSPGIPCHRVIRSNGKLGGYSGKGGINRKIILLKKEKIQLNQLLKYIK